MSGESKGTQKLNPDFSHKLGYMDGATLESQLVDGISLITGKLRAKLEILTDAIRSDSFGSDDGCLESFTYSLIDDADDIKSTLSAYCDAHSQQKANTDKEGSK